jgi:hypothetical protein
MATERMIGKRKHKESKINVHLVRSVFWLSNLISLKNAERQKHSTQQFNKKGSKSIKKQKKQKTKLLCVTIHGS